MIRRVVVAAAILAAWAVPAIAGAEQQEVLELNRTARPSPQAVGDASAFLHDVLRRADRDPRRQGWQAWSAGVSPPPAEVPAGAASWPVATAKGVDLDALLARYQGPMRRAKAAAWKYPKVLVFVSWSMPKMTLLSYMREARDAGGVLVMRGFLRGSIKQTIGAVRLLGKGATGMLIDPRLFKMFRISAVPTVVVSQGRVTPCQHRGCTVTPPVFDKVAGNIGLGEALRRFAADGDVRQVAADALARMEDGR